ncbi:hypothetical protein K440DRAFT_642421 [Wilcoxina mikolae CBS 423.85]|nr:hypothetical protein K440DRAFT_642421 [Wilcoxina mikolae CBS 423.85]
MRLGICSGSGWRTFENRSVTVGDRHSRTSTSIHRPYHQTSMRPVTALRRAPICTSCSLRPVSLARLPLRRTSAHTPRTFITTPQLFKAAAPPTATPPSPYTPHLHTFPALSAAVTSHLLTPSDKPINETSVLTALTAFKTYAQQQMKRNPSPPSTTTTSATSAILFLSSSPRSNPVRKLHATPRPAQKGEFASLTSLTYDILSDPRVFLTPAILSSFVSLQRLTRDPSPIPAVFTLYATKPVLPPSGKGKPQVPNPKQAKYAIPPSVALVGLETAIDAGDMTAALDVIDTSYALPAYRRNKVIRQALPVAGVGLCAPAAIWVVAGWLAGWQDTVDHELATKYAFTGLTAYAGLTAGVGLLVVGTKNDQMVRVTWVRGTPLSERWVREEERAALDAVAMAWGFEDPARRGDEEGEEWELLREVVGRKGMVLDDPALLDGME